MKKILMTTILALCLSPLMAQDSGAIIKKRQDLMKQYGGIAKEFANIAANPERSKKAGEEITHISAELKTLFVKGTSEDDVKNPANGAKAKIWAEKDKFDAIFTNMEALGTKLANAKNPDEAGAAIKAIGNDGCKACHEVYRTKL